MPDGGVPLYEVLRDPGFFYPAALPGMAPQPLVTSRSKLMAAVTFWSVERREGSRRSGGGFPERNRYTLDLIVIATGPNLPTRSVLAMRGWDMESLFRMATRPTTITDSLSREKGGGEGHCR